MTTLTIPDKGCCKGHPCDNCKTCQSGRCCRKDNPDYKLPELGEWDGPIYGKLGVMNDDGEKVECHCCGAWVRGLAPHAWLAHNLLASEYRSIFGLGRRTALVSACVSEKLRSMADVSRLPKLSGAVLLTSEQKSALGSRPRRLQVEQSIAHAFTVSGRVLSVQGQKKGHNRSSIYVGVTRHRKKWIAQIGHNYKIWKVGVYDTEEAAARAYDAKARELYGDKARLNFPDG